MIEGYVYNERIELTYLFTGKDNIGVLLIRQFDVQNKAPFLKSKLI